ncbi:SLC13 family permease [Priestia endophytica]|uniref:SLC13 family permease n=1 Tax=Priestia endophytica TaxID=135735 RepID=UPI000DCA4473|nr:SLC13 family permease [Priestia endophytica]RAS76284.1 C4-dicarboxylate ABC transporter [Priestia endophytica]
MFYSILIVLAIIIAIYLGEKFNINTGLVALALAYSIGCFVLGMSIDDLLATFPIKLFLVIFTLALFFNFAVVNGTLEKIAHLLLYKFQKHTKWLPLILYFITALVSGMGAGFFTSVAVMGAIAMALCQSSGMNKLHASFAVSLGSLSGANFMYSAHGVLFNSLISETAIGDQANVLTRDIFVVSFIYPIFIMLFLMFFDRKNSQIAELNIEKPEGFSKKQKVNISLIILLMVIVLGVPMLANFMSENDTIQFINSRTDITLLAVVFAIVAYLLNLAEDKSKEVMTRIPWNTLWLVSGIGMLIDVAVEAGTIDLLASLINNMPSIIIPIAVAVIAGIMSIFSSTLGVVAPLMFPMIAGIIGPTDYSPALIAVAIIIGAQSTALAPFSTGGSLILGNSGLCEEDSKKFYKELLYKATPLGLGFSIVATLILMFIL